MDGKHTAPSNRGFHKTLQFVNKEWGLRDVASVAETALRFGMRLKSQIQMPESKLMLVFRGGREFADECDQEGRRLDRATGERTQAENTGTYGTATLGTATLDTATLETATLANARMQTARWHESWEHRLNCWWHRIPLASQARLDGCLGALALHLGARLDSALRRATASPVAVGAECAWVGEMLRTDELMLPEFPLLDRVEFSVPLLPELLVPSTRWRQMVSRSGRRGATHSSCARTLARPNGKLMGLVAGTSSVTSLVKSASWAL